MDTKKRMTDWQIRCMRCDFTEPWEKSGVRLKTSGRKFIFGRCPQCKRIRLRVVEKVPDPRAKDP